MRRHWAECPGVFCLSCKGIFEPGAGKVRVSPHPSSPKYDELKLVCGLKVCIVGFRGCALAERVMRKHWDECPGVFCLGEVAKEYSSPMRGSPRDDGCRGTAGNLKNLDG